MGLADRFLFYHNCYTQYDAICYCKVGPTWMVQTMYANIVTLNSIYSVVGFLKDNWDQDPIFKALPYLERDTNEGSR